MDFESPDVEKDFPGLYASETGRKSNDSDFSDGGDHDKPSKKDLLGRRKDKKESKKDRGYAALEGESSPEEDGDTKSPSKSKKTKSFKFPTKIKEKREKSRDKEKALEDAAKQKETNDKEKKKDKEKDKEKKEKEKDKEKKEKDKKEKLKEKDKEEKARFKLESKEKLKDDKKEKTKEKEKDKIKDREKDKTKEKEKDKVKDKDKKEKKLTKIPSTVTSGVPFEEIFTLGVALPIFGVTLEQSVERSRCHDDTQLPLIVRDAIDYLQAHGITSNQIYRAEADKIKLQQLRTLYTDRAPTFPYHWDVPVACAILRSFLSELPESILTQELHSQFEQASVLGEAVRLDVVSKLISRLPAANRSLLAWLMLHFKCVVDNQQVNQANIETIATAMGPAINISLNLLTYLITAADKLFPDITLSKYEPPLGVAPASLPADGAALAAELRKQESLLAQIHAEMHAGFSTPARDQQLWEAQRIVTQLKRKLRSLQKSTEPNSLPAQPSVDDKQYKVNDPKPLANDSGTNETSTLQVEAKIVKTSLNNENVHDIKESPVAQDSSFTVEFEDNFNFDKSVVENVNSNTQDEDIPTIESEPKKPKLTEKELRLLRLELENAEYLQLKSLLQAKINSEQFEIVKLRSHVALKNKQESNAKNHIDNKEIPNADELELKQKLMKENAMLEQKRLNLINQIFQERVACVQLKIDLAMKEILSKS